MSALGNRSAIIRNWFVKLIFMVMKLLTEILVNSALITDMRAMRGLLRQYLRYISSSGAALEEMYRKYCRNKPRIARMSVISAELTKISVNSFITMKISFTNQLRMIAERFPKADIHAVLDAIGSDSRINHKYLRS